ncbi:hypothetical protein [Brevibacterium casei]|uniref:Uncharacterized protein n=1 Tax=Brevibacterium casei CIP 102111 TaxID=1255625 RepID=A0A2H1JZP3_9MICO|nr:hypothetical protein [Brevibacterium casei]QPR38169.1 hypothetical protein I6G94_11260 [Brevibacterium casei]QPR45458.1 hypothetical protein I6G93_08895 [Brevibacterium casei]SMX92961.1 hypothetical protein BC102111_02739 [Brevibacterium casei CIP 102111]
MRFSSPTKWIIALLFLAVSAQALSFVPRLHDAAAILWGVSFALLIGALALAIARMRSRHSKQR